MLNLTDPRLFKTRAYINGKWIENGNSFQVCNPATGDVIADVTNLNIGDIKHAIDSAYGAQKDWAAHTGKERSIILCKWYNLIVENANDLGTILTYEMGKPLAEAIGEILYGASFIEWFAEEAKRIYGDVILGHQRDNASWLLNNQLALLALSHHGIFPMR